MITDTPIENATKLRVDVARDGTANVFRGDDAADNPRPLGDEELEAISGGMTFTFHFPDGCTITVNGASFGEALDTADLFHATQHG